VKQAGHFHLGAQTVGALLQRRAGHLGSRRHRLHVSAGAEAAPGPSEDDCADCVVIGEPWQRFEERLDHLTRHGVEPVRPIQRERRDTVGDGFEHVLRHCVPPHPKFGEIGASRRQRDANA